VIRTFRIALTVIAAMRTCGPQLMESCPAALDGWLACPERVEGRAEPGGVSWLFELQIVGGSCPSLRSSCSMPTCDRSRKMPQIPCEKILGATDGRDRKVKGIIRNGSRDETSGKQHGAKRSHGVRDLQEIAISDERQALGGHLGITGAGFAHYDRGCHQAVLLAMTLPPRPGHALTRGDDTVACAAGGEIAEHRRLKIPSPGPWTARYHAVANIST
jgi:hypothetical protein